MPAVESESAERPLELVDAIGSFVTPTDIRIEAAAAEPEVVDPVALRFDEFGRMWVVEMRDYPYGPEPGELPKSRIRILEDRDSDGYYEFGVTFAENLLFPTGLQPWRGGVIVTSAGRIDYLKDTDGDGRCDKVEPWFRGFAEENPQLRANHPLLASDGMVYVAGGLRGGQIVDVRRKDASPIPIRGRDFSFHPTEKTSTAVTGNGQYGLTFDDFGNRFTCSNRNPVIQVVFDQPELSLGEGIVSPPAVHDVAAAGNDSRVYPLTKTFTTSVLHAGQFTAACGVHVYRGDGLEKNYYGDVFVCEPTGNLVHRELMRRVGPTFVSEPAHEGTEFLASTDSWFRPVDLCTGPDGALYVVDMYRNVIEHPDWMPEDLRSRGDLRQGENQGRIYRLTARDRTESIELTLPGNLTGRKLATCLEHPNAWVRDTAARMIQQQQDDDVTDELERIAVHAELASSRVLAIWTLHALKRLRYELILSALKDDDPQVQEQAIKLAVMKDVVPPELAKTLAKIAAGADSGVRFRVALACHKLPQSERVELLSRLAVNSDNDEWMGHAILLAAGKEKFGALLNEILDNMEDSGSLPTTRANKLAKELAKQVGAAGGSAGHIRLLKKLLSLGGSSADLQTVALTGLASGLAMRGKRLADVLESSAQPTDLGEMLETCFRQAIQHATDPQTELDDRLRTIELLTFAPAELVQQPLYSLVVRGAEWEVQHSACRALGRHLDYALSARLLEDFRGFPPQLKNAVLDLLITNPLGSAALLDSVAAGAVSPAEIGIVRAKELRGSSDLMIRDRAAALLPAVSTARDEVLDDYKEISKLGGDPHRGKDIFTRHCAACHRIAGNGQQVAPDIGDAELRKKEQLLADILAPNQAVDANYLEYVVQLVDGSVVSGIIASESNDSIVLRLSEGRDRVLPRSQVEQIRSTGQSFMPEGFEQHISKSEMADLITYLQKWRYLN